MQDIDLLIVDDEIDVREFAANFFRKRKFKVSVASSGEEAMKVLSNEKPRLILLDIKMAGIDGLETLKRIREQDQEVKVIMVTGQKPEEEDSLAKCEQLGISSYIHKPLELDKLHKSVTDVLNPQ